jgi:hypothetical protein
MINDAGKHRVKGEEIVAAGLLHFAVQACMNGLKNPKVANLYKFQVRFRRDQRNIGVEF